MTETVRLGALRVSSHMLLLLNGLFWLGTFALGLIGCLCALMAFMNLFVMGEARTITIGNGVAYASIDDFDNDRSLWFDPQPSDQVLLQLMPEIRGLPSLWEVSIDSNEVTDVGVTALSELDSIRYLYLSRVRLSAAGGRALAGMSELNSLSLAHAELRGGFLKELSHAKNLTFLNLTGASVSDRQLRELRSSRLTGLILANTPISDASIPALSAMTSLKHLYLEGTMITPAGIEQLRDGNLTLWIDIDLRSRAGAH